MIHNTDVFFSPAADAFRRFVLAPDKAIPIMQPIYNFIHTIDTTKSTGVHRWILF